MGDILATNVPILNLLRRLAPRLKSTLADGVYHVEFELSEGAENDE